MTYRELLKAKFESYIPEGSNPLANKLKGIINRQCGFNSRTYLDAVIAGKYDLNPAHVEGVTVGLEMTVSEQVEFLEAYLQETPPKKFAGSNALERLRETLTRVKGIIGNLPTAPPDSGVLVPEINR